MNLSKEQKREENRKWLSRIRLIDDEFMSICFDNYIEGAELLLRIILERDDLKVTEVKTQQTMKNLQGRDIRLDIYATDAAGKKYDIEIQRADKGATLKRARYHSSMIDAAMLKPGDDFSDLRDSYVIFITENDVLGLNEPIYHIDRTVKEGNVQMDDGAHIIYVNAAVKTKETALGRLMNDFYCTEAKDMCYKELSDRVRTYKESEKGAEDMGNVFDEFRKEIREQVRDEAINEGRNEGINETRIENAIKLIARGKLSLEEIAEDTGLSIEKVRELAGNKSA